MNTHNFTACPKPSPSKFLMLVLFLSVFTFSDLLAQHGNNKLAIGAELGPVVTTSWNDYRFQAGLPIKAYLGTGNHGQWMLRSGVHHLWIPGEDLVPPLQSLTAYTVPLAFGYRQNISNWYIEGSIGMAWQREILNYGSHDFGVVASSRYPINFGIEVGYQINDFDIGLSLQNNLIQDRGDTDFMVLVGFKAMYKIGF